MQFLKTFWPLPFKVRPKDVTSLVVQIIIAVVVCAVFGLLIGLLAWIPIAGILFGLVGSLVELYGLIDIVLCVLVFLDLLK